MSANTRSSRAVALELLQAVLRRRRPLDEAIAAHAGLAALEARDRAFARLVLMTTLRRMGQIDSALAHCLEKPLPPKGSVAHDILRLAAAQLLFLGTPPHAAVDTAVSLAEARGQGAFKGLVNAVLRRLAREGGELVAAQDAPRLNTPAWLWRSWSAAYGEETARAIATAHLAEPPLDITVKADAEGWAKRLGAAVLPLGSLRRPPAPEGGGGPVAELPGYDEGAWWVQDAAAAIPARLLGPVEGEVVFDLCAAPGGKTAQLAAAGARVTAVEISGDRAGRLAQNLERLRLKAEIVCADAARWRPPAPAPFVLLDAPCIATGALRRHPDIARIKRPGDVARLAAIQDRLLAAAAGMLAPGGRLVFCTCSLEPEEGPDRVAALLDAGAPLAREPVAASEVGGLAELLTAEGDLRTLPCHLGGAEAGSGGPPGGCDGFFAVRLRRVG
jgi:16S rRNA (cytosine967-C5)-methyltransferase